MAEEGVGQVISCHTVEAWEEQMQKGNNDSEKLVIIFSFFTFRIISRIIFKI